MAETWEQTKARLKQQGISLDTYIEIITPAARYGEPIEKKPLARPYNIHKRSLPVGIDKIIVFGVTKEDAEWWLECKLKPKCYENGPDDSKTLIYYDIVPVDATPKERSIYYNMHPVTTEPVLGYAPKRIN